MAFQLADLIGSTTVTSGTGTLTLGGAIGASYTPFGQAVTDGALSDGDGFVPYTLFVGSLTEPAAREVGYGVLGSSGTTLTRAVVLTSTNGGSQVDIPPGTVSFVVLGAPSAVLAHAPWAWCGTAGGTANALVLTPEVDVPEVFTGLSLIFVAASDNTGATTVVASPGLAPEVVQFAGRGLAGREIRAGGIYRLDYVNEAFQLTRLSAPPEPRPNVLINGCMRVAQRGESFDPSPNAISYGAADRWYFNQIGGSQGAYTVSRQFSDGQFFTRIQTNDAASLAGRQRIGQVVESRDAERLAGQVVTLTLEISKSVGWNEDVVVALSTGTGVDEGSAAVEAGTWTGGTSPVAATIAAGNLSSSFQEFSWTAELPSDVRETAVGLNWVDPAVSGAQLNVRNVRLQRGDGIAPMAHRPVAEELSLCQRYLWHLQGNSLRSQSIGAGVVRLATGIAISVRWPESMFATPTVSYSLGLEDFGVRVENTQTTGELVNVADLGRYGATLLGAGFAGLTAGQGLVAFLTASDSVFFQAEADH